MQANPHLNISVKKILTIIIGFIHDFASGCWAASVFAVYWLDRQNIALDLLGTFVELKKQFFYAGLVCVLCVFVTGAGRTFTYVDNVYGRRSETVRRKMLIIKHVFLLLIFGYGTYWQFRMIY